MNTDNDKSINDLITHFDKGNSRMRRSAARELVKLGRPTVEPLISYLDKKYKAPEGREKAVWVLGEIRDPRCIRTLFKTLGDENSIIGKRSLEALSKLRVSPWKHVCTNLRNKDSLTRRHAVKSLSIIGGRRAVGLVIALLKDETTDSSTRDSGLVALQKIGTWRAKRYLRHLYYKRDYKQAKKDQKEYWQALLIRKDENYDEDEKTLLTNLQLVAIDLYEDFRYLNVEDFLVVLLRRCYKFIISSFHEICSSIVKALWRLRTAAMKVWACNVLSRVILCPVCKAPIHSILRHKTIQYCPVCKHMVSHCAVCAGRLAHGFLGVHLYRRITTNRMGSPYQANKTVLCPSCFARIHKGDTMKQAISFMDHLPHILRILPLTNKQSDALLGDWQSTCEDNMHEKIDLTKVLSRTECIAEVHRSVKEVMPWGNRGCDIRWELDKNGILFCCLNRTNVPYYEDLGSRFLIARIGRNAFIFFDCTYRSQAIPGALF